MADPYLASNEFPGDGTRTLWDVSFKGNRPDDGSGVAPYLKPADVKAQIITPETPGVPGSVVDVPCEYVGPNQFRVTPACPVGKIVRIYRDTQDEYALVDYQGLQTVAEDDLDLSNKQLVFVMQETKDIAVRADKKASVSNQVAYDAINQAVVSANAATLAATNANNAATAAAALGTNLANNGATTPGPSIIGWGGRNLDKWLTERSQAYGSFENGQLRALKASLADPLEQFLGICLVGDSITWGAGSSGTATGTPSTGGLNSARNNSTSPCWANLFKSYIRTEYLYDAATVNTNWATSPSGQSTTTFNRVMFLYPRRGQFTFTQDPGGSLSNTETYNTAAEGTRQVLYMGNGNNAVENSHTITFPFTGTSFTLGFVVQEPTASYYEILINGVSQGTYSTHSGVDGFVTGYNNYRTHTFPYVRGATITFRTKRNGETGLREVRLQSIRINKTVRITNQGISGVATRFYIANNMAAIQADDKYLFTMLGTNDRVWQTTAPGTINQFEYDLTSYLAAVPATITGHILMAANPALNEDPAVYSFPMVDVRGRIQRAAKTAGIDFIDNYALFRNMPNSVYTADGLHPNDFGHALIFNNISNAIEAA